MPIDEEYKRIQKEAASAQQRSATGLEQIALTQKQLAETQKTIAQIQKQLVEIAEQKKSDDQKAAKEQKNINKWNRIYMFIIAALTLTGGIFTYLNYSFEKDLHSEKLRITVTGPTIEDRQDGTISLDKLSAEYDKRVLAVQINFHNVGLTNIYVNSITWVLKCNDISTFPTHIKPFSLHPGDLTTNDIRTGFPNESFVPSKHCYLTLRTTTDVKNYSNEFSLTTS